MRIKELHEILQKKTNGKVTQNDIARAIGTSRANVSKLFAKNSYINDDKIRMIEKYFNIDFLNIQSGIMFVDYYPNNIASFVDGEIKLSDKYIKCAIPTAIFPIEENTKYIMCHANDDSMSPIIFNGDFIIIKRCLEENIYNNQIYLFIYKGNIYIKRLTKNINQIVVVSENKDYQTQYISKEEMKDFYLIGIVVYIGRAINAL